MGSHPPGSESWWVQGGMPGLEVLCLAFDEDLQACKGKNNNLLIKQMKGHFMKRSNLIHNNALIFTFTRKIHVGTLATQKACQILA